MIRSLMKAPVFGAHLSANLMTASGRLRALQWLPSIKVLCHINHLFFSSSWLSGSEVAPLTRAASPTSLLAALVQLLVLQY
jgi:hypothetical protein